MHRRVAAEHAIGRLKDLGADTARYFGCAKTQTQLPWTAATVNFCRTLERRAGAPGLA